MDADLEKCISNLLFKLGIPPNLCGFEYDKTAIALAVKDITSLNAITKELYPAVAKRHKTTWSKAERGIRYTIKAMKKNNRTGARELFGRLDRKITNGEFIATIAEYIRLNRGKEE